MIFDAVGFRNSVQGVFIARRRHIESLQKTKESLEKVREYLSQDQFFLDMVAEELRLAGVSMGQILGEFTSDQLLGKIFSTFLHREIVHRTDAMFHVKQKQGLSF